MSYANKFGKSPADENEKTATVCIMGVCCWAPSRHPPHHLPYLCTKRLGAACHQVDGRKSAHITIQRTTILESLAPRSVWHACIEHACTWCGFALQQPGIHVWTLCEAGEACIRHIPGTVTSGPLPPTTQYTRALNMCTPCLCMHAWVHYAKQGGLRSLPPPPTPLHWGPSWPSSWAATCMRVVSDISGSRNLLSAWAQAL